MAYMVLPSPSSSANTYRSLLDNETVLPVKVGLLAAMGQGPVGHLMSWMMTRMVASWDSILSVSLNWMSALARLCSWWLALK